MKLPRLINGFVGETLEREPSPFLGVEDDEDPDSVPAHEGSVEDDEEEGPRTPRPTVTGQPRKRRIGRSGVPSANILSYDAEIGAAYDSLRRDLGRIPTNREVAFNVRWRESLGLPAQSERVRMALRRRVRMALRRLGREGNRVKGPVK